MYSSSLIMSSSTFSSTKTSSQNLDKVIKHELPWPKLAVYFWKHQETEPHCEARAIPAIPPLNAKTLLSADQYLKREKQEGRERALDNEKIKKIIFLFIEQCPSLWEKTESKLSYNDLVDIALDIYQRTKIIVRTKHIAEIWKKGKNTLQTKLRECIKKRTMNERETETEMWNWSLYGYIQFYRFSDRMFQYEQNLRKKVSNGEFLEIEEDEIIFEGSHDYVRSPTIKTALSFGNVAAVAKEEIIFIDDNEQDDDDDVIFIGEVGQGGQNSVNIKDADDDIIII